MPIQFTWYGPSLRARIEREVHARLRKAATVVRDHASSLVSSPGGSTRGTSARLPGKRGRSRSIASSSGLPHQRSGQLARSIVVSGEGSTVRVVVTAPYAGFLEHGTRRMASRPFLLRAFQEKADEVGRIVTAPLGSFQNPIDVTS